MCEWPRGSSQVIRSLPSPLRWILPISAHICPFPCLKRNRNRHFTRLHLRVADHLGFPRTKWVPSTHGVQCWNQESPGQDEMRWSPYCTPLLFSQPTSLFTSSLPMRTATHSFQFSPQPWAIILPRSPKTLILPNLEDVPPFSSCPLPQQHLTRLCMLS